MIRRMMTLALALCMAAGGTLAFARVTGPAAATRMFLIHLALGAGTTTATLPYGAQANLSGSFANGAAVIKDGSNNVIFSNVVSGQVYTTAPLTSGQTYTLLVTNDAGDTASASVTVTITPPAVSPVSPASTNLTVGKTVLFSATVSGAVDTTVVWAVDGVVGGNASVGTIDSAGNYTAPAAAGPHIVSAIAHADGTTHSDATVSVDAAPVAPTVTTPANVTASKAGYTASIGAQAGMTYSWALTGGGTITAGQGTTSITWTAPASGSVTATCTVTNAAGDSAQGSGSSTVVPAPVAPTVTIPTYATASKAGYTASIGAQAGMTYSWALTGGGTITAGQGTTSITWTAPASGSVTATCTVTNAAGDSAPGSGSSTVVPAPTVSLGASTTSPLYGATTVTVTPTFTGGTAVVGTSTGGSDISASATSGTAIGVQTGGFTTATTYWARVTNPAGDTQDASVAITPQTVTIAKGSGVTAATVSTGYAFSVTVGGAVNGNVTWSADGGSFSATTTASGAATTWTAPATAGTYTVTAASAALGSTTTSWTVSVYAAPVAPTVTIPANVTASKAGYTASIGAQAGMTYSWALTGGGSITAGQGTTSITWTAPASGSVTATCTVTNAAGDSAQGSGSSTVVPAPVAPTVTIPTYATASKAGYTASIGAQAGMTYSWSLSGGGTITAGQGTTSITWTAPASGSVTATCTVTNAAGDSAQGSGSSTVVPAPTVSLGASTTNPPYGATTVTVTPTFTGGTAVVGTSTGGSEISASATSGTAIGVQAGGFTTATTYWARVTSPAGDTQDASVAITPQTVTIAKGSGVTAATVSTGYAFSATVGGAANSNVTWSATGGSFSPTSTASGATTTWTAPATAGTYTVTAASAALGSTTTSWTVSVYAAPVAPTVTTPANVTASKAGYTASIGAQAGMTYSWALTGGGTITAGQGTTLITWTAPASGSVTATCTVTNAAGTSAQGSGSSTVVPAPVAPTVTTPANVTASKAGYTASIGAQVGMTYSWALTGGGSITAGQGTTSITWTAPASGSVTATCTVTNAAGDSAPGSGSSTVVPAPVAPTVTIPTYATASKAGYTASIGAQAGMTYSWSLSGGGTITAGQGTTSITWTAPASGSVTATCTVTNAAGDSAQGSGSSTVVPAPTVSLGASTTNPPYGATTVTVTPTFTGGTAVVGTSTGGSEISASATSGTAIGVQTGGFTAATTYWARATNPAGDTQDASVAITPQTVTVGSLSPAGAQASVGSYVPFVVPSVSGTSNQAVTWTSNGGTFTAVGGAAGTNAYWKAPSTPGTYTITATSQADGSKVATTTVSVIANQAITGFSAASGSVPYGGATTLTGAWTNANGVIYPGPLFPTNGSPIGTGVLTANTTYTLYADPVATYPNQVPNGNCEDGAGAMAAGGPAAQGLLNDPANAHAGSWVRRWTIGSGWTNGSNLSDWTPANPGTPVRFSAWVKASATWVGPNNPTIYILYTDASGNYISGQNTPTAFAPTTAYQWVMAAGTVPAGAAGYYAYWELNGSSGDVGKNLYMDDLFLSVEPTAQTTVSVTPPSVSPISGGGGYVSVGYTRGLSATVVNAVNTNITWSATGGTFSPTTTSSGGTTTWTAPGTPGVYTIYATAAADGVTQTSTTITVVGLPTASISASPSSITSGDTSTLSWSSTNWSGASINPTVGGVGASGSTGVAPSSSTTYTLSVSNAAGQTATATAGITVYAQPTITSFSASPSSITAGQGSTLSWVTGGGTTSASISGVGAVAGSGSTTVYPSSTITYTLTASNPIGSGRGTTSSAATVTVYPVATVSISVTPSITAGSGATLSWSSSGASSVNITNYGNGLAGSGSVTVYPSTTTTYTATPYNPLGAAGAAQSSTCTVYAVPTVSVWVDSTNITAGNVAYLNWSSTGASYVNITNYGSSLATSGRVGIVPGGTTTYTGTAYNPVGAASSPSAATVNVWGVPSISSFTANPTTINSGQSSTLYPVFSAPGGSGSISPTIGAVSSGGAYGTGALSATTTYTLTATNGAGTQATAQTTVTVNTGPPPSLTSFGLVNTRNPFNGCNNDSWYATGFVGTADSWSLTAPNGKVWTGGAISGTGFTSPEWLYNFDCGCTGQYDNQWAPCGNGVWTLVLTRNGQQSTTTFNSSGSCIDYQLGCTSGGTMACPW